MRGSPHSVPTGLRFATGAAASLGMLCRVGGGTSGKPLSPWTVTVPGPRGRGGSAVRGDRFEAPRLQACRGPKSLLSPIPGPGTVDSQGQIEFLRCFATLKTKSQTKFYLEFHSSCLESKGCGTSFCSRCLSMGGPLPHCSSLWRTRGCISRGGSEKWGCGQRVQGNTSGVWGGSPGV